MATGTARISSLIRDVEKAARRLRAEISKRATPSAIQRNLENAASELRKRATSVATQVEKYVSEVRKDIERRLGTAPKKTAARKPAARKTARKRTTRKATARKATGRKRAAS